jgi:hypothetical protein
MNHSRIILLNFFTIILIIAGSFGEKDYGDKGSEGVELLLLNNYHNYDAMKQLMETMTIAYPKM